MGRRITAVAPKSPKNARSTFCNTVNLLPEELRFEHEGAKLSSCPGHHLTSLRPWANLKTSYFLFGVQTIENTSFETKFIWDHVHLSPISLQLVRLRPHWFETAFIWDLLSWDPFIWDCNHVRLVFSFDCCDQRKKTLFFSRLFISQLKTETIAESRLRKRSGIDIILWLGLTKWHFRGATLPSKPEVWRVTWPLRCFKCECMYNPA